MFQRVLLWFESVDNRKKVYRVCAALGPVLVALGFVTDEQVQPVLEVLGGVLLFGTGTLAHKNAK